MRWLPGVSARRNLPSFRILDLQDFSRANGDESNMLQMDRPRRPHFCREVGRSSNCQPWCSWFDSGKSSTNSLILPPTFPSVYWKQQSWLVKNNVGKVHPAAKHIHFQKIKGESIYSYSSFNGRSGSWVRGRLVSSSTESYSTSMFLWESAVVCWGSASTHLRK